MAWSSSSADPSLCASLRAETCGGRVSSVAVFFEVTFVGSIRLIAMPRFFSLIVLSLCAPLVAQGSLVVKGQVDGVLSNDQFGASVSGATDANGDGLFELIVGVPGSDLGSPNGGEVAFYDGATGSLLWRVTSPFANSRLGLWVAGAGDFNNDGIPDVLAGAPNDPTNGANAGAAYVYSGIDGSVLWAGYGNPGDLYGSSVSGVNDIDLDGYSEIVVGAPSASPGGLAKSGSAWVISGATGTVLWQMDGTSMGENFGGSCSGAGLVDDDAIRDVIVGSPDDSTGFSSAGSVRVISGATGLDIWKWVGTSSFEKFGSAVSGARDFDKDGRADLMVGAPFYDGPNGFDSGTLILYSGRTGKEIFRWDGGLANDRFGTWVNSTGDVNADGTNDFIVGAPLDDWTALDAGAVYVISGDDASVLFRGGGLLRGDRMGSSVTTMGDLDGDGRADLAASAPFADPNAQGEAGQVVIWGPPRAPTVEIFNLVAGSTAVATFRACTPNGKIYLAWSAKGGGPVSTPWGNGLVTPPFKYVILNADPNGNLVLPQPVPSSAAGLRLWFHGADAGSATLLNPMERVIG